MDIILRIPWVSLRTQSHRSDPFPSYYGIDGKSSREERWRSEGIQIGGVRSARGVLGYWFDKYVTLFKIALVKSSTLNIGHTEIMICMAPQAQQLSGNRTMESRRRSRQQGIILH